MKKKFDFDELSLGKQWAILSACIVAVLLVGIVSVLLPICLAVSTKNLWWLLLWTIPVGCGAAAAALFDSY